VSEADVVVGIDLGTTNSEVAAFLEGRVQVLGAGEAKMVPSSVGLSPRGELLVGKAARNQQLLYPERTVRSIKRQMGTDVEVEIGERKFTPQEVSAVILRALVEQAERDLGGRVKKAVITVPAYFSDAQRQATREAGALAGLEVVRILNEPTAASLAYGYREARGHTVLVYDLGGGTFDVSIVHIEGEVTEVLASHGNNSLGGDDFDALLLDRLAQEFLREHGVDLRRGERSAHSRLWWAVEEAKKQLSAEPYAKIREEAIVSVNGKPLHLEREISREEYEELIRPLVESTLESVSRALADAGKKPSELDAILLVGGSTRTPLVSRVLEERTGLVPRQEVHPDLCVALGAGILASRLSGREVERVLVDVSPYSFGPSFLGERGGYPYPHCYKAVVRRNTPLPVTRAESYYTSSPFQSTVEVRVYQGEDEDALKNVLVGNFTVEGLTETREPNEVLCRMSLDVDGILRVTAIEKRTGKSKQITIQDALREKSEEEIAAARKRLEELFSTVRAGGMELFEKSETPWEGTEEEFDPEESFDGEEGGAPVEEVEEDSGWSETIRESYRLVERSRSLFGKMHDDDKEEAIDLNAEVETAIAREDREALEKARRSLEELLFFVEGK